MIIAKNDPKLKGVTKERLAVRQVREALKDRSVVILYGPRKVGKTTALKQLGLDNPKMEYIDCGIPSHAVDLKNIYDNEDDVTVLLDEVHKLPLTNDWVSALCVKAHNFRNFKVVITGSVTGYMSQIARANGGGRNRKVRMPIITYLEYLYFTNVIPSYGVDLKTVNYGDSFQDYMTLKDLEFMNIGPIDQGFLDETVHEFEEATENNDLVTFLLKEKSPDIVRSFLLLGYKLIENWSYQIVLYDPNIGSLELKYKITDDKKAEEIFEGFSIYKAAASKMTDLQITAAVRYLLWSELALYNQIIRVKGSVPSNHLIKLYLGLDNDFSHFHIKDFFENGTIDVVNPLIYSAISEEFWGILDDYIKTDNNEEPDRKLFNVIRQKLSSRTTFLRDKGVVGCWAESYLRGSFAILSSKTTPMTTWTYHDEQGKEVDIAGNEYRFALIECGVRDKDKTEKEVYYRYAYTGKETCILATKRNCGVVFMNGIKVLKIPYYMLAAFLDRGEIPNPDDFPTC
jgi:hypothetical protein